MGASSFIYNALLGAVVHQGYPCRYSFMRKGTKSDNFIDDACKGYYDL